MRSWVLDLMVIDVVWEIADMEGLDVIRGS